MKNSKPIVFVFILFALSITLVNAQTAARPYRVSDAQLVNIIRQLERSSSKFRITLNGTPNQKRSDDTSAEKELDPLARDFENITNQFRDLFNRGGATAADAQTVLQKSAPVNDFLKHNRVTSQVQNDWAAVRTSLKALANAYRLAWSWNRQNLPASKESDPLTDTELDQLIQRIENGGDALRSSLTDAFDQVRYDPTRSEGAMNDAVRRFKSATEQLRNHFDTRQLVEGDIERLIGQATLLEKFMRNNKLTDRSQSDWSILRAELTTLAQAYNLNTFWGNTSASQTKYSGDSRLSGTFRLNPALSDNPRHKANQAIQTVPDYERQAVLDQILGRLESPEMLAIDRRGPTVSIASSLAPQSTFEADGRERQEQLANGRSVQVTATLRGDQLVVNSNGYRENDFNVTFDATENDRTLRVRRQIYSDRLTQPVVVDTVYNRTAAVADWSVNTDPRPAPANAGSSSGVFIVPEGMRLLAVLNTNLTTKEAKRGDRFVMTVRLPNEYAGAVVEGTIASVDRGGRLPGRSQISLNFESIRLSDGKTYKFAGIIQNIRTQNGETVQVDNEGGVADGESQAGRTIQRAAIGTAVGTVIGAIAGGGKGAVIGAVVGAAAGAGSIYVQGKDAVELQSGSEITIRASAPPVGSREYPLNN